MFGEIIPFYLVIGGKFTKISTLKFLEVNEVEAEASEQGSAIDVEQIDASNVVLLNPSGSAE